MLRQYAPSLANRLWIAVALITALAVPGAPMEPSASAGRAGQPAVTAIPGAASRASLETLPEPPGMIPATSGACVAVPILYYHYIRVNPVSADEVGFRLSVTPENFARQMALLRAAGANTVSIGEVMRALAGGPPLPAHPVVLTFDDGHDDFATRAAPVLMADGLTATVFVVPGFFGRAHYLTAEQVLQLAAEGFTIGAHTMHHVNLVSPSTLLADLEITTSRQVLQQLTGQPVLDFAYPYGRLDPAVELLVERAGFRDAASTYSGSAQCMGQRWALRRTEITGSDSLSAFAGKAGIGRNDGGSAHLATAAGGRSEPRSRAPSVAIRASRTAG